MPREARKGTQTPQTEVLKRPQQMLALWKIAFHPLRLPNKLLMKPQRRLARRKRSERRASPNGVMLAIDSDVMLMVDMQSVLRCRWDASPPRPYHDRTHMFRVFSGVRRSPFMDSSASLKCVLLNNGHVHCFVALSRGMDFVNSRGVGGFYTSVRISHDCPLVIPTTTMRCNFKSGSDGGCVINDGNVENLVAPNTSFDLFCSMAIL